MTSGISRNREDIIESLEFFGFELIEIYKRNNRNQTRVIFKNSNGYKFDSELTTLIDNNGKVNSIDKSNPFSLENISIWLELNNKNFTLVENQKYKNKEGKLNFLCFECDDVFIMSWNDVRNGNNCSVCRGIQTGENHSFGNLRKDLLEQWSSKNKISPFEIGVGYTGKVLWECPFCPETYDSSPYERGRGRNCPYCSGKKVSVFNSLEFNYPEISKEWDYKKNYPLTPKDVTWGSGKPANWICSKYGHKWKTEMIADRTSGGKGCPKCSSSKGELKILNILKSRGFVEGETLLSEVKFDDCKNVYSLPFDFYLPDYNLCIEYQGEQHYRSVKIFGGDKKFKDRIRNDKIKLDYCRDNNILLLIISYLDFNNIEQILTETLFS